MPRYIATGNGLEIPLTAKTLDGAIAEVERGGRKFCAEQTFDIALYDTETDCAGEEVAVMVDIQENCWLEAWGDPEDEAEKYRA